MNHDATRAQVNGLSQLMRVGGISWFSLVFSEIWYPKPTNQKSPNGTRPFLGMWFRIGWSTRTRACTSLDRRFAHSRPDFYICIHTNTIIVFAFSKFENPMSLWPWCLFSLVIDRFLIILGRIYKILSVITFYYVWKND